MQAQTAVNSLLLAALLSGVGPHPAAIPAVATTDSLQSLDEASRGFATFQTATYCCIITDRYLYVPLISASPEFMLRVGGNELVVRRIFANFRTVDWTRGKSI